MQWSHKLQLKVNKPHVKARKFNVHLKNYISQLNNFLFCFFLSFAGNDLNSCSKLGNAFVMRAGDHDQMI